MADAVAQRHGERGGVDYRQLAAEVHGAKAKLAIFFRVLLFVGPWRLLPDLVPVLLDGL